MLNCLVLTQLQGVRSDSKFLCSWILQKLCCLSNFQVAISLLRIKNLTIYFITHSEQPFISRYSNSIVVDCSKFVLCSSSYRMLFPCLRRRRENSHFYVPGGFDEVLILNFLAFVWEENISGLSWLLRLDTKLLKINCRCLVKSLIRSFCGFQLYLQFLAINN